MNEEHCPKCGKVGVYTASYAEFHYVSYERTDYDEYFCMDCGESFDVKIPEEEET